MAIARPHMRRAHRPWYGLAAPTGLLRLTLVLCLAVAVGFSPTVALASSAYRVWVDAGHGGTNVGAVHGGYYERHINLAVSMMLTEELQALGVVVGQTRTSDVTVENTLRPKLAETFGAELFVSIHCNGWNTTVPTGPVVLYQAADKPTQYYSKLLADRIQVALTPVFGTPNYRNYPSSTLIMLNSTSMPAVLVELAWMSTPADLQKLINPTLQRQAARVMAASILETLAEMYRFESTRVSGPDRYETAVAASRLGWPQGAQTVVLASGQDWPDALSGSALAGLHDAPILLTTSDRLPDATAAELARLSPERIFVLGGTGVVADSVADAATIAARAGALDAPAPTSDVSAEGSSTGLTSNESSSTALSRSSEGSVSPIEVIRLGGADRYETSALIAQAAGIRASGSGAGRAIIASGTTFADGVSASALASRLKAPILLVNGSSIDAHVSAFLEKHNDSIASVEVIGGTAVVPKATTDKLMRYGAVTRSAGESRYSTSLAVAQRLDFLLGASSAPQANPTRNILLASGADFADALTAGALAARLPSATLVLVQPSVIERPTAAWLSDLVDREEYDQLYLMGGSGAISNGLQNMLGHTFATAR